MKFVINQSKNGFPYPLSCGDNWEKMQSGETMQSGEDSAFNNVAVIMLEALTAEVYVQAAGKKLKVDFSKELLEAAADRKLDTFDVERAAAFLEFSNKVKYPDKADRKFRLATRLANIEEREGIAAEKNG